jgi:biopolymer transport protein TolR
MGMGHQTLSRSRARRRPPMSEINVTPLVDVMLVLLVVFMVAAPLMTVGVPVDLPETKADAISEQDEPLVISIDAKGRVYLQETQIDEDQLVDRLRQITQNKLDSRIFVRGDKSIDYGHVMQVMGLINTAGFNKVALIAQDKQ